MLNRFRSLPAISALLVVVASGIVLAQGTTPADPLKHPLSGKTLTLENSDQTAELELLFQTFSAADCLNGRFWSGALSTVEEITNEQGETEKTSQSFDIVISRPGASDAQRCSYTFIGETTTSSNPPQRMIRGVIVPDGNGGHTIKVSRLDISLCENSEADDASKEDAAAKDGTPEQSEPDARNASGDEKDPAGNDPLHEEEDCDCYEYEGPVTLP